MTMSGEFRRARLFEITDGEARDWVVAYTADEALEFLACEFHEYDTVRCARLDGVIEGGARELTDEELDTMQRRIDEDSDETLSFREAMRRDIEGGESVPYHFSCTE